MKRDSDTILNIDRTPLLVDDFDDEKKDPESAERTSLKRLMTGSLFRENARHYFNLKPLKLAVIKEQGRCCGCFSDCLPAAWNNCWFFCACCCFFGWSSLPRLNCLLDFIIVAALYCHRFDWDWSKIGKDMKKFNLEESQCDIVFLAFLRATILFFVFAYRNHREWYEFNLFYGVVIAILSTIYGLIKWFLDPQGTEEFVIHGGGQWDVIIFFVSWIWFEVLVFGLVRRKKIRIPLEAVKRRAHLAYGAIARNRVRRASTECEEFSITKEMEDTKFSEQRSMKLSFHDESYFATNKESKGTEREVYIATDQKSCSYSIQQVGRSIKADEDTISPRSSCEPINPNFSSMSSLHVRIPDSEFSKFELPLRYPTSSFLKIRGINVHLRIEEGDLPRERGPAILCLHGFGSGVFSFSQCWEHLKSIGSLVAAFDRPGFGLTTKQVRPWAENPYRVDLAVDICRKIVEWLEVPKVLVVAHGSGCLPANYFCKRHPERVESLVMLSPAFHAPSLIRSLFKTRLGKAVITQLVRTEMSMLTMRRAWINSDNIPAKLEKQYKCILELDNWDNAIWEMLRIEQPDQDILMREFGIMGVPVLLLHGKEDRIIDISETEEFVQVWRKCNPSRNIRFVPLENVGHVVHEEFPDLLLQELRLFFNDGEEQMEDEKEFVGSPTALDYRGKRSSYSNAYVGNLLFNMSDDEKHLGPTNISLKHINHNY